MASLASKLQYTCSHTKHIRNANDIACCAKFCSLQEVFVEHLDLLLMHKTRYEGFHCKKRITIRHQREKNVLTVLQCFLSLTVTFV